MDYWTKTNDLNWHARVAALQQMFCVLIYSCQSVTMGNVVSAGYECNASPALPSDIVQWAVKWYFISFSLRWLSLLLHWLKRKSQQDAGDQCRVQKQQESIRRRERERQIVWRRMGEKSSRDHSGILEYTKKVTLLTVSSSCFWHKLKCQHSVVIKKKKWQELIV